MALLGVLLLWYFFVLWKGYFVWIFNRWKTYIKKNNTYYNLFLTKFKFRAFLKQHLCIECFYINCIPLSKQPKQPIGTLMEFYKLVLAILRYWLKHLFAPTSQSRMSRIFRDSESLGKSNGKKLSQIWKLLLIKVVKSPRKKCLFLGEFSLTEQDFF